MSRYSDEQSACRDMPNLCMKSSDVQIECGPQGSAWQSQAMDPLVAQV